MNKLMMTVIGMVVCSVLMTGCMSSAVTKGGSYANLPDPKPDEYQIHWENEDNIIETTATVRGGLFGFCGGSSDKAPWMLRDEAARNFFGARIYSLESKARNAALYKACQQAKCDALIGATYEVETESYGMFYSESTCKVKGWPARITGIEKVVNKTK
ncbi:MAG: hypothetical protein IJU44_05640 [Kiritimatiellae bacterium]|nr:hypothetical protein [Kiritimatiellia bacterium]